MVFEKLVVIDCRGHLLGRLCSIVAKQLLMGQKIVLVRCEEMEISGPIWRNKIKLAQQRKKRTATNPKRGPFHFHAPAKMIERTVRGMLPHKTIRGKCALLRFKAFDGIPHPYDRTKRVVVPEALSNVRISLGRKVTNLGKLASMQGWKHAELIQTLEDKRKAKSAAFYEKKKAGIELRAKAEAEADIPDDIKATLAQYGH